MMHEQATGGAELTAILNAFQDTTLRLQKTHETLQAEVRRLTQELEVKNRELARKNRLADLGRMASHIAHEVRNNLVPVTLYMSLLRRHVADNAQAGEVVEKIEAAMTALDATVNDLLHFTVDRDPHRQRIAIGPVLVELVESLAPQFSAQEIAVDLDIAGDPHIDADVDMLRRAILNLVLNAVDAMPQGGRLSLSATIDAEDTLCLRIEDTGPGLSDEALRKGFEPFFSTKHAGTGLGLAIVHRTAEVHGGIVTAVNGPDRGALFTMRLPRSTAASTGNASERSA